MKFDFGRIVALFVDSEGAKLFPGAMTHEINGGDKIGELNFQNGDYIPLPVSTGGCDSVGGGHGVGGGGFWWWATAVLLAIAGAVSAAAFFLWGLPLLIDNVLSLSLFLLTKLTWLMVFPFHESWAGCVMEVMKVGLDFSALRT